MERKARLLIALRLWASDALENCSDSQHLSQLANSHLIELVAYLSLAVAIGWALLGLYWDATNSGCFWLQSPRPVDGGCFWFQRSGAILVATALTAEFFVGDYTATVETHLVGRLRRIVKVIGYGVAILGTLVWSYGDVPFHGSA